MNQCSIQNVYTAFVSAVVLTSVSVRAFNKRGESQMVCVWSVFMHKLGTSVARNMSSLQKTIERPALSDPSFTSPVIVNECNIMNVTQKLKVQEWIFFGCQCNMSTNQLTCKVTNIHLRTCKTSKTREYHYETLYPQPHACL